MAARTAGDTTDLRLVGIDGDLGVGLEPSELGAARNQVVTPVVDFKTGVDPAGFNAELVGEQMRRMSESAN